MSIVLQEIPDVPSRNAGCSKKSYFSPAQPRRVKTRRSAGKVADDESTGGVASGLR
jgi:hypothetical protein